MKSSALKKIIFSSFFASVFLAIGFAKAQAAVTMSLDPATATIEKNATKDIKLMLNSGTQEIMTADVYIEYDATKLEITSSSVKKSGTSTSNCEFGLKGVQVDSTKVRFMVWCEDDQGENHSFTGSNHLATVTVKALVDSGSTVLKLKFDAPGQTAGDCNASLQGVDYLTAVENGTYNFTVGTPGEPDTYLDCVNSQCVEKEGSQADNPSCSGKAAGASCSAADDGMHLECSANQCVSVAGEEDDEAACDGKYAGSYCLSSSGWTYLKCVSNQCVATSGTGSDELACSGKNAGASCSSGTTTKGGTTSGVPATAGNEFLTILSAIGALSLIIFGVFVL